MCRSLKTKTSDVEKPTAPPDPDRSSLEHKPTQTATHKPLQGVKPPTSSTKRTEANAYFQIELECLNIMNVDNFAIRFQQIIYLYFAKNYGYTKTQMTKNLSIECSIKKLKKN
ncbi:hypothetical protein HELRODRAFT_166869 [Helobdella robusta]|uniref:Uncharacterized protein n=1 Tax=Helobdella robusta TaxID=6412 RepID=T1EYN7_HELRO|nr:hypothetical protein HELRODRAFT_166869 [Helobdella robusta]ESO11817.1 hypothetical protein HELRODRAFT_166869 [Helobdella robusta]